jgi:hypothetical protein
MPITCLEETTLLLIARRTASGEDDADLPDERFVQALCDGLDGKWEPIHAMVVVDGNWETIVSHEGD